MTLKLLALYLLACVLACTPTQPTPTPVGPLPDDIFAGKTFDCTDIDTSVAEPLAGTCGDTGDVATCMVMYAKQGASPAALTCAARDVQVAGFIAIAKGTAGPDTTARARALRAWLLAERIQLRN